MSHHWILLGYAIPFDQKNWNVNREIKVPFQLCLTSSPPAEETADFYVSVDPHSPHLFVKTSSYNLAVSNVKQEFPQGLLLLTFIQHLQTYGLEFFTLYDYVMNQRYLSR